MLPLANAKTARVPPQPRQYRPVTSWLSGLGIYDGKIKAFVESKIEAAIANSIKYVDFDAENKVLKFYTVNPVTDEEATYEVELPEQDLSHLMQLVEGAVNGDVATFGDVGQVVDSGVKLADLATKSEVDAVDDKVDALDEAVKAINHEETGILT